MGTTAPAYSSALLNLYNVVSSGGLTLLSVLPEFITLYGAECRFSFCGKGKRPEFLFAEGLAFAFGILGWAVALSECQMYMQAKHGLVL